MSVKSVTMRVLMDDTVLPIGDTCHAMMCRVRADGTLPIGEFQVLRVEPHSWMKTLEDTSQSTGEHTMYPVYKHTGEFDVVEEYFDRLIVEGLDYHPEDSTHSIDTFVKRFTIRERDILDAQMNLIIEVFGAERTCAAMLKRTKPKLEAAIAAAKVEPVHLLIEGDLESGFKIIGPFSDAQSGLAYRKANDLKGQVWITTTPAAYAAQWNSAA